MAERLYIVAECGGTHNGSLDTALELIQAAKAAGADAVKFTMRDLDAEMSPQMAAQPYLRPHSYGATYGEHRVALEFDDWSFKQLRNATREAGLYFGLTVCAPSCVERALLLDPAWLKVASRDAGNVPLLRAIREQWHRLVVLSDGLDGDTAMAAAEYLREDGRPRESVKVLHTVSQYPADPGMVSAAALRLRDGYSDHCRGWHMVAVVVAASGFKRPWIEKHLTLDRNGKGSDHVASIEPAEFAAMVAALHDWWAAGSRAHLRDATCWPTFAKLGRSVAAAVYLDAGHRVTEADLHMVSPGTGLPWAAVPMLVGKRLRGDKRRNELLTLEDVE